MTRGLGMIRGRNSTISSGSVRRELSHHPSGYSAGRPYLTRHHEMDIEKRLAVLEKGHKVCKLQLLKRWEPTHKKLTLNRANKQILLSKFDVNSSASACSLSRAKTLDIRLIKEVHTLAFILETMKISDKWAKDKEIRTFKANQILVIFYGSQFIPNYWIFFFEKAEICRWWCQGIEHLIMENSTESSVLAAHFWLRRQFWALMNPITGRVDMKHLKPFVQSSLQYKLQSKQLLQVSNEEIDIEKFQLLYKMLIHTPSLFNDRFSSFSDDGLVVSFDNYLRFLKECQKDEEINRKSVCEEVRRYLRDIDPSRDNNNPYFNIVEVRCPDLCNRTTFPVLQLSVFPREQSLRSSASGGGSGHDATVITLLDCVVSQHVIPLAARFALTKHHSRYLTGDQLRSESSIEAYARALLSGCRCVELDCWDGQKKNNGEFSDVVIYHGYTMTSKLNLRDVLYTIRHYAFIASDYPVILSIEDNCSLPAQRLLAQEVKEILGDLLLTSRVNRDEVELPSPEALKRKIILKHKKLPLDGDTTSTFTHSEEDQEIDILARECMKRSILMWKDPARQEWSRHVVVLTADRLYITNQQVEDDNLDAFLNRDDSISQIGDDENEGPLFDIRPEDMHVTEEWFHGKTDRNKAKERLLKSCPDKADGTFLVRESCTFIGDYSLSFIYNGSVHHCRIRSRIQDGVKRYSFQEVKFFDTLYELITYHTHEKLETPKFNVLLTVPCPQPQPHLNQPWYAPDADQKRAEELLNTVHEDGAFLIRHSSVDRTVFVLSLRADSKIWHYRLKRDGRIFVVNQTVFENLNQIVAHYTTCDFVRGVSLKLPVNERTVGQYASGELMTTPGFYMELKDLTREVEVRSIRAFVGTVHDHLSFPVNALIRVTRKEPDLWKGRYGNNEGWFRPEFVEEVVSSKSNIENMYDIIELAGMTVERVENERRFALRVTQGSVRETFCCETEEELLEWISTINEAARNVNTKMMQLRSKEKHLRIAAELSNLVVYCQAVPFNPQHLTDGSFCEMCSFSEAKHEKILEKGLIQFNIRQLSRVYPMASRMTSSNFNPVPMWNSGCHMVALNYQTPDKSMQLNYGKFLANGRCGYVLKPKYLLDSSFNSEQIDHFAGIELTLTVVAGRHLTRKDRSKGICSPFVEVEVVGMNADAQSFSSRTISSNGLNPIWNETVTFRIRCPEVAMIRFLVQDGDFVSDPFIGQAVFPVDSIRGGFRSVPLLNQYSDPLELSSLLVHVDINRSVDQFTRITPLNERRIQFCTNKSITMNSTESEHDSLRSFSSPSSSPQPASIIAAAKAAVSGATVVPGSSSSYFGQSLDHMQYSPQSPDSEAMSQIVSSPRKSTSSSTLRKFFRFGGQKSDKTKS
uniref:Phosphoinositide phospholipase C n=1 Tax=Steinernema glaseri TaxID=37863 RepID=A0A1I7Z0P4_9BILA